MNIKEIQHSVIDFIFPRHCVVCDRVLPYGNDITSKYICKDCIKKIDFIKEPFCKKCGASLHEKDIAYCDRCSVNREKSNYDYGIGLCRYTDSVKESLHLIKYKGREEYIDFYGKCLAKKYHKRLNDMHIDCFVPIPIHKHRLIKRNYNQSLELSKSIEKALSIYGMHIKTDDTLLSRIKDTKVLNKLDDSLRSMEVKGAFKVIKNNYDSVCIVDDIYTTGSTIEEAAKALKTSGIKHIYFVVIAVVDNL